LNLFYITYINMYRENLLLAIDADKNLQILTIFKMLNKVNISLIHLTVNQHWTSFLTYCTILLYTHPQTNLLCLFLEIQDARDSPSYNNQSFAVTPAECRHLFAFHCHRPGYSVLSCLPTECIKLYWIRKYKCNSILLYG
jgi:hypothetical protein